MGSIGPNGISLIQDEQQAAAQDETSSQSRPVAGSGDGGLDDSLRQKDASAHHRFQKIVDLMKEAERRRGRKGSPASFSRGEKWKERALDTYNWVTSAGTENAIKGTRLNRQV